MIYRDVLFEAGMGLIVIAGMVAAVLGCVFGVFIVCDWVISLNLTYNQPYSTPVMIFLGLSFMGLIGGLLVVASLIERKKGGSSGG